MWSSGTFASAAAGTGLSTIWDALVDGVGKWSVYDASAGTNAKVYRCHDADENIDFYVYVKDNNSGYWEIELWEGWDAVGHAGIGIGIAASLGTITFRARRPNGGGWYLSVLDHRIIYIDATNWQAQYIGAPRRYDRSKNIVLITGGSAGTTYYNNLAYIPTGSNSVGQRFLFDENGNSPNIQPDGGATNSTYRQIMGIDGVLRLAGEMPIAGSYTGLAVGTLEGVADLGAGSSLNFSPTSGETVSIDGVDWLIFSGTYSTKYWSAVRMA
jgi:hypothetical protein